MVDDGKSFWQGTSQWRFVLSHDGAVSCPGTTGWTEKIEVWSYAQPEYPMFIRSFIHSLNWNSPATNLSVSISWLSIHTQHPPQALCFKNLQDMFEKQWTSAQFLCTWWCYVVSYPQGISGFFVRKMRTLFRSCLKRDIMDAYWIQSADGGSCCVHPVSCVSGKQSRLIIGFAELAGESNSCSSVIEATATICSYWYH